MMLQGRGTSRGLSALVATAALLAVAPATALAAPPVNTVPGPQSTNEDTAKVFSAANANAISVDDPDAPLSIEVSLTAASGKVTLAGVSGLVFIAGDGTSDAAMTFTGTIADANTALDGMSFLPDANFNGAASLTIDTSDPLFPVEVDTDVVAITVNAVNDNPVNSVPGTQTTDEDTAIELSTANGNAISVSDVDAGAGSIQVNLDARVDNATDGTVTLDGTSGLTFSTGDGTADPTMTFQGTIANINAALDGMSFTPKKDAFGTGEGQIDMNTSDLGNSGSGGTKQDTDDVLLFDVDRVDNDPPAPSLPPGVATYQNLNKTLSFADRNQLKIEDPDFPDAGTTMVEVELESTHGTMTLASIAGLTITSGANGGSAMTLRGLQSDINGALDGGLTFGVEPGFTGQATIEVTTDDLTPLDPAPQANDTFEIEVDQPEEAAYWVASKETVPPIRNAALARAELDGGGGADLVTGPELFDTPAATAIDAVEGRIYWMNTGAFNPTQDGIWSANLDGTDKQLFLSDSDTPPVGMKPPPAGVNLNAGNGMVIDQETRRIYWANTGISGIYWVSLDDIAVGGQVSTGAATVSTPDALALDLENDRVIWTNVGGAASTHRISYAPLPPTAATPANSGNFNITGAGVNSTSAGNAPNGVAVDLESDPDRLYWTLGNGGLATDRLRYADLPATFGASSSTDLTGQVFNISPNPGGGLRTPVIDRDANRIYWLSGSDKVSYANLDGTGGGADLATGPEAFVNSPDGLSILKKPKPISSPSVSGTLEPGSTLTCGGGTWAGDAPNAALYRAPASFMYEWTRDGNTIAGANAATYTPTQPGEYRCKRTATNFAGTSTQTSAAVNVLPLAPTCSAASASTDFEQPVAVTLNCAGEGPLTYSIVSGPAGGSTSGFDAAAGTLTYTPAAGFSGTDQFTYRASNSGGDSSTATATITVASAPVDPPSDPPANPPSNEFTFGKVKYDEKHGTAKLAVTIPGPGEVELAKTKDVKAADKSADAAGTVKLPIAARGDAAKTLDKKGAVKVTAKVTFTPDGGTASTQSTKVKLKLSG